MPLMPTPEKVAMPLTALMVVVPTVVAPLLTVMVTEAVLVVTVLPKVSLMVMMGCVVNGPGESKHANVGISLPGSGENPVAPVFVDGVKTVTLKGEQIAEQFQDIVQRYVEEKYPA